MLILSYFSLFVPILGFTWLLTSPFFFSLQGKKAKEEKWNHKKREEKSQNEPHSLKKQKTKNKSLNPTQISQTYQRQNHNHFIEIHDQTSYMNIVHQIVTL
jgi:hypothetical protein